MGNSKSKLGSSELDSAQETSLKPPAPQPEDVAPRNTEYDWVLEYIDTFIRSPECRLKIEMFIDENCIHFPVQPIIFDQDIRCLGIHEEFAAMVKGLLQEHLDKLGVTMEQFENSLWNGGKNAHNTKVVQYFDAVNDFQTFTTQMVARHHKLESEAQNLMGNMDEKAQLEWALQESKKLADQEEHLERTETKLVEQLKEASIQMTNEPITGHVTGPEIERILSTEPIPTPKLPKSSPPPPLNPTPPRTESNTETISLPPLLPNNVSKSKTTLAPLKTLPDLCSSNTRKKAFNPDIKDLAELPQLSEFELQKVEKLAKSRKTGGKGLPPLMGHSSLPRSATAVPDKNAQPSEQMIRRKKFLLAQKQKILQQRRQELEKEISGKL